MTYRIRYRKPDGCGEAEMVVEAGSPTEAMVKFQCSRHGRTPARCEDIVTSVRAEEQEQSLQELKGF